MPFPIDIFTRLLLNPKARNAVAKEVGNKTKKIIEIVPNFFSELAFYLALGLILYFLITKK